MALSPQDRLDLILAAFFVGFIGDALLQFIVSRTCIGGPTGWGLLSYFKQHGGAESLFIAGGMLALFYIIYFELLRLPLNLVYLIIYGILLDLFFRITMMFPSLRGYYCHMNYFWSAIWGIVPILLPTVIAWRWTSI